MNIKTLYSEITAITYSFETTYTNESWEVRLRGKLSGSSDRWPHQCSAPVYVKIGGKDHDISDALVFVFIKPRPQRSEVQGISPNKGWLSNDDARDHIFVSSSEDNDGQRLVELRIYLPIETIDRIKNTNLKEVNLSIHTSFWDAAEDPRPMDNSPRDQTFAYLTSASFHFVSAMNALSEIDGGVAKLNDNQDKQFEKINSLYTQLGNLLKEISENQKKFIKIAWVLSFLLTAGIFITL